ncbi:hypothetical protein PCANC_01184 [Puccinia coronata f. sp. avenae]|uniref:Uncharacterized protein n=1 Tax=Puccinia coronata f. sp. avenae TaxID=200324 RepID=A0A2N5W3R1_9BASI|nr:hypothetical protein PCANC_01184 [Puccinia coronata f. sp. avenae]
MEMLTRLRSSNGNVPLVDVNRSSIFLAHLLTKGSRQEGAHVLAKSPGRNQAHACLPRAPVSKTHLSPEAPTSRHTPAHWESRQAGAHLLTRSLGEQGYAFSPRAPESRPASRPTCLLCWYRYQPSEQADLHAELVLVPAQRASLPARGAGN